MPGEGSGVSEGVRCARKWRVTEDMAAKHLAGAGVKVLSTPCLALIAEATVRECLDESLPEGYTTVGTGLYVRHRAPVPVGGEVLVEGLVVSVDGPRVTAYIKVSHNGRVVGEVLNERRVVSLEDYAGRAART